MKSKIIYAKTKDAFQRELPNIPENLNPLVFIEDTREVWILGNYFSIGSPGVFVTDANDIITIEIGQSNFTMSASGDNITIRKGSGNNIIFSSSALSSINTEAPLKWDNVAKKLTHEKSDVTSGNYGETASADNVSLITIPWFSVDTWGHIIKAENRNIKIRDYVEQVSSSNLVGQYNLLIGYSGNTNSETNPIRKALGLSFDPDSKSLNIEGGLNTGGSSVIAGDLTVVDGEIIGDVRGNVTGTATPKIHLSDKPEYGGASTNLYGHVKIQDDLTSDPGPSSDNSDLNSSSVNKGIAASPKMVWDVKQELLGGIDAASKIKRLEVNDNGIDASEFPSTLKVKTSNGLKGGIDPVTKELTFSGVEISGYDNNNDKIIIEDNLEFTTDFDTTNNKVSLRWVDLDS